jgi:opacity protein-like surface antigen
MAEDFSLGKTYLRLDTGASFSRKLNSGDDDVGTGGIIGGGIGYRFNDHLRSDVTLAYRAGYKASGASTTDAGTGDTLSVGKADISSTAVMTNLYYDVATIDRFTPYVGGGLGLAFNKTDAARMSVNGSDVGQGTSTTNTDLAWQLSAGASIAVTGNLSADIGYRYQDLGKVKAGINDFTPNGESTAMGGGKGSLSAHEIQAGMRYNF